MHGLCTTSVPLHHTSSPLYMCTSVPLHHLCTTSAPLHLCTSAPPYLCNSATLPNLCTSATLQHICTTSATLHHCTPTHLHLFTFAPQDFYLVCTFSAPPPLHNLCITPAPLHLPSSSASPLHHLSCNSALPSSPTTPTPQQLCASSAHICTCTSASCNHHLFTPSDLLL